jgi:hypothetical protein
MKRLVALCLGSLALIPAYSIARDGAVVCGGTHFVRVGGTELRSTTIGFRNLDLVHPTTIERITIRNSLGEVVHDSGPEIGVPHPRSTAFPEDFPDGFDITVVPPGANYGFQTNDIWGSNNIPLSPGRLANYGQDLAFTIEFSKRGKRELFMISASSRSRDRLPSGGQGAERSRNGNECREVPAR